MGEVVLFCENRALVGFSRIYLKNTDKLKMRSERFTVTKMGHAEIKTTVFAFAIGGF